MRVASIDLGSNTFELLIADKNGTKFEAVFRKLSINRLGGAFDNKTKRLNEESMLRSLKVMTEYSNLINENRVERLKAVATSVVRNAVNSHNFLQSVYNKTGIEVDVISGYEESRLSSLGVVNSLQIESKYCIVVDIGGGSTELSVIIDGKHARSYSVNLGVVNISENIIESDIPTNESLKFAKEHIFDQLCAVLDEILSVIDLKHTTTVFNAGTPLTLACSIKGIKVYDPGEVDRCVVSFEDVTHFFEKISSVGPQERIKLFPAIKYGREDLIIPGTLIILEVLNKLKSNNFLVSQAGILEGLIYQIE